MMIETQIAVDPCTKYFNFVHRPNHYITYSNSGADRKMLLDLKLAILLSYRVSKIGDIKLCLSQT